MDKITTNSILYTTVNYLQPIEKNLKHNTFGQKWNRTALNFSQPNEINPLKRFEIVTLLNPLSREEDRIHLRNDPSLSIPTLTLKEKAEERQCERES